MSLVTINTSGLKGLQKYLQTAPEEASKAMVTSINAAARFAFAESSRQMRAEVNFSQEYIGSAEAGNRLKITLYATKEAPEARLRADPRPVSLARFAVNRSAFNSRNGIDVEVHKGKRTHLPTGFLIKLAQGNRTIDDTSFNIGLAVRLKPGQTLDKRVMVQYRAQIRAGRTKTDEGLYLLYGPSVDQVFNETREKVTPAVLAFLEREFLRQFLR